MADESSEVMLDINSLETEAARLLIPFLRTASLMKHYIYKENLPEIKDDDEEFDLLVKFLDLISVEATNVRGHRSQHSQGKCKQTADFCKQKVNKQLIFVKKQISPSLHSSKK